MKKLILAFLSVLTIFSSFVIAEMDVNNLLNSDKKYNLTFKQTQLSDAIKILVKETGLNVVAPENMTGNVNIALKEVTIKNALDAILLSYGYNYKIEGNIVRIYKEEAAQKKLSMEMIPLKYASAAEVKASLDKIFPPGSIQINAPTNSLLIREEPKVIEEIKKVIAMLDVKTRQILIETRIVNANESFSRDIGIEWGGVLQNGSGGNKVFGMSAGGTFGDTNTAGNNFMVNLPTQTQPFGNFGVVLGSLNNNLRLDLALQMAEEKGKAKVVSAPRILTLDNKRATIRSGATLRIRSVPVGSSLTTSGNVSITEVTTGVELGVTPQISGEDQVLLTVDVTQSEPNYARTVENIPEIRDQRASTSILLKDGETVVIGGLYKVTEGETQRSIPFLSDIPLIGWLFKSKSKEKRNEELIIFLTPKIVKNNVELNNVKLEK